MANMNQYMKYSLRSRILPGITSGYKFPAVTRGRGLVHIYAGDRKSNSTVVMGTVFQALEHGLRVYISFFTPGYYPLDSFSVLNQLSDITVAGTEQTDFDISGNVKLEQIAQAGETLASAREAMFSGQYEVVILSEAILAAEKKLIAMEELIQMARSKPVKVELVLTGERTYPELTDMADAVTEIRNIKENEDSLG